MKILHIVNEPIPIENGGGTHIFEVEKNLVKLGHEVHVICPKEDGYSDYDEIEGVKLDEDAVERFRKINPLAYSGK